MRMLFEQILSNCFFGDGARPDGLDHREAIDEALGRAGYPSSNTETFCSLCLTPSKSSPPSTRQPAKATPSSPAKSTIHHLERTLPSASTVSILHHPRRTSAAVRSI